MEFSPYSDQINWASKYELLQLMLKAPYTSSSYQDGAYYICREAVVKLDALMEKVNALPKAPLFVVVIADVVCFPKRTKIVNQAYIIITRLVKYLPISEAGSQVEFSPTDKRLASLSVYSAEVGGVLAANISREQGGSEILDAGDYKTGIGIQFSKDSDQHLQFKTLQQASLASLLTKGKVPTLIAKELDMSLSILYQMATAMIGKDTPTARKVLQGIKTFSTDLPMFYDQYLQSSALLAELNLEGAQLNFVPVLNAQTYKEVAVGFVTALKAFEDNYNYFDAAVNNKEDQLKYGQLMLDNLKTSQSFTARLIAQAENNMRIAENALENTQKNMRDASLAATFAGGDFSVGIKVWEAKEKLSAAFSICTAVITFAPLMGRMFMGDASAAGSAGAAAAQAASAANAGVKALSAWEKFNKIMDMLAKSMENLTKVGRLLGGLSVFINKVRKAAEKISQAEQIGDFVIPSSDNITAQTEWNIFKEQVDSMMAFVVEQGIDGARAYRLALVTLSIYGKAQAEAQAALLQVTQEAARLYLQQAADLEMETTIKKYLASLKDDQQSYSKAKYDAFVMIMNIKRNMFNAERNYTRAYKYWALRESTITPSILKTANDLLIDVGRMNLDYADALAGFDRIPQDFGNQTGSNATVEITSADSLKLFKETGNINFAININDPFLKSWNRVRITRIRVWLYGLPTTEVELTISNSGQYADRNGANTYRFSSKPTELNFSYNEAAGQVSGIIMDGEIASELTGKYFEPTPYTEWNISVPKTDEFKAHLKSIQKIVVIFSGKAIPAKIKGQAPLVDNAAPFQLA